MTDRRRFASLTLLACAVASVLTAGCSNLPWRKVSLEANSGFYSDAALTYRLDAGLLALPLDVVRVEGQRLSYEQVASSPLPEQSIGTLTLEYPHPTGKAGWALARFKLDSGREPQAETSKSWNPLARKSKSKSDGITSTQPEVHETWELEIPASEAEAVFKMLTEVGFYAADRTGAGAHLTVKMNGRATAKDWNQLPALNLLVQRTRGQGRLVAYSRPTAVPGQTSAPITGTAAYSELTAWQGRVGTPPLGTNAFAMAVPTVAGPPAVPQQIAPGLPAGPGVPVGPPSPYPPAVAQRPGPGVR